MLHGSSLLQPGDPVQCTHCFSWQLNLCLVSLAAMLFNVYSNGFYQRLLQSTQGILLLSGFFGLASCICYPLALVFSVMPSPVACTLHFSPFCASGCGPPCFLLLTVLFYAVHRTAYSHCFKRNLVTNSFLCLQQFR